MSLVLATDPHSVAAAFDGAQWDFFAVRALPNRWWGVVHTASACGLDGSSAELLRGMPTRARAVLEARRLAVAAFNRGATSDRCPRRSPHLAAAALATPTADVRGDCARIGVVITVDQLATLDDGFGAA